MTRRRFFAPPDAFSADHSSVTLSAEEARHARDVLRLREGAELFVFDGLGREFQCVIQVIKRNSVELAILKEVGPASPESSLKLTLAIALLKGEKFDLVIQKTTELGVHQITPLLTERTDIKLAEGESTLKRLARWQRIALESGKQAGRAYVPTINPPRSFDEMLKSNVKESNVCRVMFSERDGQSLPRATDDSCEQASRVCAMVGPEGGWTDEEIQSARQNDWKIVTLGGRTLRAETAGITVVALLQHRLGDLV
jgi:16S rRNA (uracil1498-N3)-methyltransferase